MDSYICNPEPDLASPPNSTCTWWYVLASQQTIQLRQVEVACQDNAQTFTPLGLGANLTMQPSGELEIPVTLYCPKRYTAITEEWL